MSYQGGKARSDAQAPTEAICSVIIPAHNEEAVIERCLSALSQGVRSGELEVVVVCNGCTDATAERVRSFLPEATVLETPVSGKAAALNLGDKTARSFPRVYLDADIEIGVDSLRAVARVLRMEGVECAAPRPEFDMGRCSRMVRSFYAVWAKMPYITDDMIGSGVYALSESGRGKFQDFPLITADDQFVMRQFDVGKRRTVDGATFVIHVPQTLRGLVLIRTRVYRGNAELAKYAGSAVASTGTSLRALLRLLKRNRMTFDVIVYGVVNLLAKFRARYTKGDVWERDDSARRIAPRKGALRIGYLVSRYPSVSHTFVMREVLAVRGSGLDVRTFSVQRSWPEDLLSEADRRENSSTWSIRPVSPGNALRSLSKSVARHPSATVRSAVYAICAQPVGARARLWGLFYFVEAVLLVEECRQQGVRHLHAHLANVAADVAWIAADLGNRCDGPENWSWTFTMHGPTEFANIDRFNLVAKCCSAKLVLCISEFARSQLMAVTDPEQWEKFHVVHMGVESFRYSGRRKPVEQRRGKILCVGRLDPVKGHLVLLEAVRLLLDGGTNCRLTIVGAGPGESQIKEGVERLGLGDHVTFSGAVGQDDLPAYYDDADIFSLPSFSEGVPVVLMEAMASGVPVVTTTIMGIPELIDDGVNGLLVPPGRADMLASALKALLEDPSLGSRLSDAGRRTIQESFDSEACGEMVAMYFRRILSGGEYDHSVQE